MRKYIIILIVALLCTQCIGKVSKEESKLSTALCNDSSKRWYTKGIVLGRKDDYVHDVILYKNGKTKLVFQNGYHQKDTIVVEIKNNWTISKDSILEIKNLKFKAKLKYIDKYILVFRNLRNGKYSSFKAENPNLKFICPDWL